MTATISRKHLNPSTKSLKNDVTVRDFAPLFVALLSVTLAAAFLLNFSYKEEGAFMLVSHTREVFHDSQELLLTGAKADMSARNYLLTHERKYLLQYNANKSALHTRLESLITQLIHPETKVIVRKELEPAVSLFIGTTDYILTATPITGKDLEQQEKGKQLLDTAIGSVQQRELKLLQERSVQLANLSQSVAQTRLITVLIAMAATVVSLVTLQLVMKKDRAKIHSLEREVENTQIAEKVARDALQVADDSNQLKTQFIANISHEIRTPMVGILGPAELLCSMPLDEKERPLATTLLENSRQLLSVLNDLLNFSKLQRNDMKLQSEPFKIRELVTEVVRSCESSVEKKGLKLSANVQTEIPETISADKEKIRMVLLALLSNSIKFTNEGAIDINIDFASAEQVRVAVIDTGIGIAEEGIGKLFQPFVQVDGTIRRHYGGAGLGLFLAKQFIQIMSGEIGVKSEPGAGSIFWFTFKLDPH
jgi:signal transduction histidine kinase